MAVNAVVIRNGIPVPVSRENFIHMEEGLSIEIGDNYKSKGKVYLTNLRLIFLKRDPSREFSSFSLPYTHFLKHKYSKKMMGGAAITGTAKPIVNGGLDGKDECKFSIQMESTNTGKALYNLLEKELNKVASSKSTDRFKLVEDTPTLPVEFIFPDQFAQYKQQKARESQIVMKNNSRSKQIIVGQSHADAPMNLTPDHRAQKAQLFSSSNKNVTSGPIQGASPANTAAFSRRRLGKSMIQDDNAKYQVYQAQNGQPSNDDDDQKQIAPPSNAQYKAYIDPSNPNDVVISVPANDDEFGDEGTGDHNRNDMYQDEPGGGDSEDDLNGMYKPGNQSKGQDVPPSVARAPSTKVVVSVGVDVDDDEDDFAQRPKVQPASVNIAPPPKSKKAPKKRRNVNSQSAVSAMDANKKSSAQKNPLQDSLLDSHVQINSNSYH